MAVNLTTNPLLLVLVVAVVVAVVLSKRSDAAWSQGAKAYLVLALVIIGLRVLFQVVLGLNRSGTVLFTLPSVHLPAWAAGIRVGGPVTAEALLATVYDALRLAAMLVCIGAANSLANPRRALRSVPAALYDASVAVVIALTVAPQLVESAFRVRRARRLRGGAGRGVRALNALIIPVLQDAVDRSMALAAGMEVRGYGRLTAARHVTRATTALLIGALMVLTFATFALLTGLQPAWVAPLCLLVGAAGTVVGLRRAGATSHVTRYRPDPWRSAETLVALSGAAVLLVLALLRVLWPAVVLETADPLHWPSLHPIVLLVPLLAAIPALAAPAPPRVHVPARPAPRPVEVAA